MKKICVLGAGLVGKAMAIDLSKQYKVTSVDINQNSIKNLNSKNIQTICGDISDDSFLKKTISPFDLVIGAVPGFMGYKMLKNVIKYKKNIVDISFFPEDPFTLNNLAIKKNVTAVVDYILSSPNDEDFSIPSKSVMQGTNSIQLDNTKEDTLK